MINIFLIEIIVNKLGLEGVDGIVQKIFKK